MWYICTVEYYPAGKKNNDFMKFAGKFLELEKNHFERRNPDPENAKEESNKGQPS